MTNTRIATQKVDHCTELRRSFHHCRRPRGLDSLKACLRSINRSCQKEKRSIRRSRERRKLHRAISGSRRCSEICPRSHRRDCRQFCGKRRARVRSVSSTRGSGKMGESQPTLPLQGGCQSYSTTKPALKEKISYTYPRRKRKKPTWWKINTVWSSSERRR